MGIAVFAAAVAGDLAEKMHHMDPQLDSAAVVGVHSLACCTAQELRIYRAGWAELVEAFGRIALVAVVEIGKACPYVAVAVGVGVGVGVAAAAVFAKGSVRLRMVAGVDSAVYLLVAAELAAERSTPAAQPLALVMRSTVERRNSAALADARSLEEPN